MVKFPSAFVSVTRLCLNRSQFQNYGFEDDSNFHINPRGNTCVVVGGLQSNSLPGLTGDKMGSMKIVCVNVTAVYATQKLTRHKNDCKYKSMFKFNRLTNSLV
jgi:hypothetical protein